MPKHARELITPRVTFGINLRNNNVTITNHPPPTLSSLCCKLTQRLSCFHQFHWIMVAPRCCCCMAYHHHSFIQPCRGIPWSVVWRQWWSCWWRWGSVNSHFTCSLKAYQHSSSPERTVKQRRLTISSSSSNRGTNYLFSVRTSAPYSITAWVLSVVVVGGNNCNVKSTK